MNAPVDKSAKATKVTPMMAQFMAIKQEVGEDILLFYRMGDFYELFFDDAVRAAAALDIALTKRGKHQGTDIPMCGVPVHAAETYLQRLIKRGFRVAVCEQTESPAEAKKRGSKSVVRREVVRTVTPGTLTEDALLDARGTNYILSLSKTLTGDYAISWADVSDGSFQVCAVDEHRLTSEIAALGPREVLLPEALYQTPEFLSAIGIADAALTPLPKTKFDPKSAERQLLSMFKLKSLDGLGNFSKPEISAAGALLDYLELTQAGNPVRLSPLRQRSATGFMAIDPATRASLEIDRTQKGARQGSLLSVLDRTITGPGARLLTDYLNRPLVDLSAIRRRHDAVGCFLESSILAETVRDSLRQSHDLARAVSRLSLDRGGPRDIRSVKQALTTAGFISGTLSQHEDAKHFENLKSAADQMDLDKNLALQSLLADIEKAFKDEVPMLTRDGGFIRAGWNAGLDELRKLRDNSRRIVAGLQADYARQANVPSLKIKHNNVLGYFIEVTPRYADQMLSKAADSPFIHRQTLVSGIRFTTTELAELDRKISGAAEKAAALEIEIFREFTSRITGLADPLRLAASALARIDVYSALAIWAQENKAVRPEVNDSLDFEIMGGRHPVVEYALKKQAGTFTANDCRLDASGISGPRLTLITGPNMAGKSTYLRQNALMFILAQAGGFVPALSAKIGIADSLYSRVGASDDLSKGRSTFMTEMIETAAILNLSSARSFIILDEIGRGTATFDGLSIAWATAEHLHEINGSRALFATHYHELTDLAEQLDHVSNACLRAKEWDGELIFLHDVQPGAADKSYGVQVAKLAGLPQAAIARARDVLSQLEDNHDSTQDQLGNLPLFASNQSIITKEPSEIDKIIEQLDVDELTPRAALDLLYDLKIKQKNS
ncbi:MAG: DNA mismatch repair protein MutS [Hellea sp.]|nr:DNA mismatch repair protein MutS [Hellea sp.]